MKGAYNKTVEDMMPAIGQENLIPEKKIYPALGVFLGLTALFSAGAYYFVITLGLHQSYMGLLMWMPALAAFATCKIMGISFKIFGWQWGQSRWQLLAYGLPVLYGLVAYAIIWGVGFGGALSPHYLNSAGEHLGLSGWSEEGTFIFSVVMFGVVAIYWRIANALGEELGWRGFLVPLLMRKFGFVGTSLISGLIWSLWHAPLIFYTQYNAGPYDQHIQFMNYALLLISLSFIMTYLRLKSGSVWTAAILHASHNAFVLTIFTKMTVKYESSWQYIGEFGYVLPLVTAVFALYYWRKAVSEGLSNPLNKS